MKKLRLRKNTLRMLTTDQSKLVLGGARPPTATDGTCTCGGTCANTLCPGTGCQDPTVLNTCGC